MNVLQHELSCINALLASKKLEMKVGIINLISNRWEVGIIMSDYCLT